MSVHVDPKLYQPSTYVAKVAVRKKCGKCGKKIRGKNHAAHCGK